VLAYTGGISPNSQFSWVDRSGRELAKVQQPSNWGNFDLSPDGRHLVTSRGETGSGDIWSIDLERGVQTRLTFDDGSDGSPVWSPDGQRIAFTRVFGTRGARFECQAVVIPAAGGKEFVAYHPKERGCQLDDWSPDGRFLTFNRDPSLMALPLTGDRTPWPYVQTANANLDESHFSPDGKWTAYSSNESGTWQAYLAPFPPTGERWQISADGGVDVRWRTDAKELYYLGLDGQMIAVDVTLGPKPVFRETRPLFQSGITVSVRGDNYAVSSDGQRFLLKRSVTNGRQPINVVLNWDVGLK
jgi:Tol biopolymer transport system component